MHKCPSSIPDGRWRKLWVACLDELDEPGVADARLLERMILNLMSADFSLGEGSREPLVVGSTGQLVENPHFKIAGRCDTQALAIARQLRLTPLARGVVASRSKSDSDGWDDLDELAQKRAAKSA